MKETIINSCKVIVDVSEPWFIKDKSFEEKAETYTQAARQLMREIERHVDGFDRIDYEIDTSDLCSFCGSEWEVWTEEDEAKDPDCKAGSPVCCAAALAEWEADRERE